MKRAESIEGFGHKLDEMIVRLKIPASRLPLQPKQWHRCIGGYDDGSGGQPFEMHQAHEAWRYGLQMEATDEAEIFTYIDGINHFLQKEIPA